MPRQFFRLFTVFVRPTVEWTIPALRPCGLFRTSSGWFARTASLLETVGRVLLQGAATSIAPTRAIVAEDAFARLHYRERAAANTAAIDLIGRLGLETHNQDIAPEGLDRWFAAFRHLRALEIWENHAQWITKNDPELGRGWERFVYAAR